MPAALDSLCADLLAERAELLTILGATDDAAWSTPTPAPGWSVIDQVTHLAWFDGACRQAISEPQQFVAERDSLDDLGRYVEDVAATHRTMAPGAARAWLADAGQRLVDAALDPSAPKRVPWYGPDMSLTSAITARLMETWAHGLDVADALGVAAPRTDRMRHVVFIGVQTMANSFITRGLEVPQVAIRVELAAPDGEPWVFGPADATQSIRGEAFDFCCVVTQRRHRDDTTLVAAGADADRWLSIAQAFAGPPGAGREPGEST